METFLTILISLLISLGSVVPVGLGLLVTVFHFYRNNPVAYNRNLYACIAAGTVSLLMLSTSLFGDALSSSSTAALVFVVTPVYSALAWLFTWCVCFFASGKPDNTESTSSVKK